MRSSQVAQRLSGVLHRCRSACPEPCQDGFESQLAATAERLLSSQTASTTGCSELQPDARRWREMRASLQQDETSRTGRRLPSMREARQAVKSGCSAPTLQEPQTSAVLDWRDALAAARAEAARPQELRSTALTDTFGRKHTYLRISLTERCNLRCLYCMPEEGAPLTPSDSLLTTEEVIRLAGVFVEAGISKIRLTGGEPTLRRDIVSLTSRLSAIPGLQAVGITSNGIALQKNLEALQSNGLQLLNLSLDTLRSDRFEHMTRRRGLERVLETIEMAIALGYDPVKVNVVVMRGVNDDEIGDFVELTRHKPLNVRFIEYMPFDGNVWSRGKMVPFREMFSRVASCFPEGLLPLQDPKGEVAKNFRIPGFRGSVSFITSMTKAFCSDCNRLRLMADGNLKVCLFGANEVGLRDALREGASDEELLAIISAAVDRKRAAHAGMFELSRTRNRAMVHIGG